MVGRVSARAALLLPAALLLAGAAASARSTETRLHWRGRSHALDALPELGDAPRAAVEAWAEFARARGLRLDLEDQGRLLLITPGDALAERQLPLVQRVLELFERELPPPPVPADELAADGARSQPPAPSTRAADELPEDPEGPPPRWKSPVTLTVIPDYEWGRGTLEPDVETATMLVLADMEHQFAAVDVLVAREPYLEGWARTAREQVGFVLERPLCGAFVLAAEGQEEWSPDHELVHRVASLLFLRRFGQQPWWLLVGWSWHVEIALLSSVYCFPYRDEFVWATEHEGWERELVRELSARGSKGFDLELVAGWKRGTWKPEPAHQAWGLVAGILALAPGKLPAALDELRRFRDLHDRKATSATTWERVREYEIPVADQLRVLRAHLGQDFERRLREALLDPRSRR